MTKPAKYLGWLLFAVLGAVTVVFAVSNLQPVELDPWPLGEPVEVATYLVVLLSLLAGLLLGMGGLWLAGLPARRRAARDRRENARLKAELEALRAVPSPSGVPPARREAP